MRFALERDEPRWFRYTKRALLVLFLLHVPIWIASSYRAWVQIYRLDLEAPAIIRPGTVLYLGMTSSGRTESDARVELIQGADTVRLGEFYLDRNRDAAYDFRSRRGDITVTVDTTHLRVFGKGPALLHASAVGRPQWMRVPPPTFRDLPVTIDY